MTPVCTVMLLTEDSATDSFETIQAVFLEMIGLLDSSAYRKRLRLVPAQGETLKASKSTYWKSRKGTFNELKVSLIRDIATRLMNRNGDSFVVFHVDSDCKWSEKKQGENVGKFEENILTPLRTILASDRLGRSVDDLLKRLILMMPHYSIEAWLFQNTALASELCKDKGCKNCLEIFSEWHEERAELDEIAEIKTKTCLGGKHNLELATKHFPAREVLSVRKSFADAVETLQQCGPLREALERSKRAV